MRNDPEPELCAEARQVVRNRRREALRAGLSRLEARLYAESSIDTTDLRRLVKAGFTHDQMIDQLF